MKTKAIIMVLAASAALAANGHAQAEGGGDGFGIGVGVGAGVGIGIGVGAGLDVERVPGNVVQGRRVFAAKFITGISVVSNLVPGNVSAQHNPSGSGRSVSGGHQVSVQEYATTISIFNPTTNFVTFSKRAVAGPVVGAATNVTLGPFQSHAVADTDIPILLGPVPGFPGKFSVGFVVIDSQRPLEVVAAYQCRDEQREIYEDRILEALYGPPLPLPLPFSGRWP